MTNLWMFTRHCILRNSEVIKVHLGCRPTLLYNLGFNSAVSLPRSHSTTIRLPRQSTAAMEKILLDNSTLKFFMEYGGFLSNHMSHGLIAVHRLGGTQERLEKFASWYEKKLDPKDLYPQEYRSEGEKVSEEDIAALMGKREKYYVLYDHYENLLKTKYKDDMDSLLQCEFPKLARGMVGSALHGLIHTGYGYAAASPRLVCEGLAYLHHSYLPLTLSPGAPSLETLGQGNMDILDVLHMFREDVDLYSAMVEESLREDAVVRKHGYFQPRVATLLLNHGDSLAEYVQQVKFPSFFNPKCKTPEQLHLLLKWLVDCAIIVYLISEHPNDFFLVHGVTGAWSLRNLLKICTDYEQVVSALRTYMCILLAAYTAEDNPKICKENLTVDKDTASLTWTDLAQRALDTEYDEHVYKMVQVCWDMDKENTDPEMTKIYKKAALNAISCDLWLLPGVPRL